MFGVKGWPDRALRNHIAFNDGTGTTPKDRKKELDAVLTNTEEGDWVPGKIGLSITLDGVDEFCRVTATTTTDFFSVALWVNLIVLPTATNDILSRQDGTGIGRSIIFSSTTGLIQSFLGGINTSTSFTATAGTFFHAGLTYNNGVLKMYIDGALRNTTNRTEENATGDYMLCTGKNVAVFTNAQIDDFRVFDRVLSDAEMLGLASLGV